MLWPALIQKMVKDDRPCGPLTLTLRHDFVNKHVTYTCKPTIHVHPPPDQSVMYTHYQIPSHAHLQTHQHVYANKFCKSQQLPRISTTLGNTNMKNNRLDKNIKIGHTIHLKIYLHKNRNRAMSSNFCICLVLLT